METDNIEEVSAITDQTKSNGIQRNLIDSSHDINDAENLFRKTDCNNDDNNDDTLLEDEIDYNDTRSEDGVAELTQFAEEGASLSASDLSNLDQSRLDESTLKNYNYVFNDTVDGGEEGKDADSMAAQQITEMIQSKGESSGRISSEALPATANDNDSEKQTVVQEDSAKSNACLTKPFEDSSASTSTPGALCRGSKDVAISDADDDEYGEDDVEDEDDDDLADDSVVGAFKRSDPAPSASPSTSIPDAPVAVPAVLATVEQSLEEANRSCRDVDPEEANVSFLHLDATGGDETFDTSAVFTSEVGEISYILHDGSFISSDALVFGEVGEEENGANRGRCETVVVAASGGQRLEMVEVNQTSDGHIEQRQTASPNSIAEGSVNASKEATNGDASDSRPAEMLVEGQPGTLPEGFDVNGGELVYLQDGDGEGRLIQLPSNAVFQAEDGTVTMILPDTTEAMPNEGEMMVEDRPSPDLFRPDPSLQSQPDSPSEPPLPLSTHPRSEGVVGLDQDVLLSGDDYRQRAAATVDVVAEDIVNVAAPLLPPPPPPKKKKKKSGSSKMVEGVVEYDLAGFPEDGVIPTDSTNPMAFPGAVSAVPAQIPPNRASGPEVVSGIPAGDGDVGVRRSGAFPCATPGMIQDADTIRALCYDYIDHLITTNRGKIAIPRTHEFGDIGGWGFLHFNPSIPPSFEEYQRHVSPLPKREDFPSKGFSRFLSCRGYLLPKEWERLLPENSEARELYNLGAMQIYARRLCPDALFDPRDDPSHTPEMGVNDAYYSFLASTQQRRPPPDVPLLAITDSKHQAHEEDRNTLGFDHCGSLAPTAGVSKKKTRQHSSAGNTFRNLYRDFPDSPMLALPPPPASLNDSSIILDETNVSFRGEDFEICEELLDNGDATDSLRQRALDSVPFHHSASYIVPQSNAVALRKVGKSNVPLVPSIIRNLDRIICRIKGQRKEHYSTRRKGGEFGFLALGLIRDPPQDSEKMITHRTVYEEKEILARTVIENSSETEKRTSTETQIKVEAEDVVAPEDGKRGDRGDDHGDNDDDVRQDGGSPPRRRQRITTPSPPKNKRESLRQDLRKQTNTPPQNPYRIEKPTNPPPRPSKPRRGVRHSMRIRRSQAKRRRDNDDFLIDYEEEDDDEEDENGQRRKRGLSKRSVNYRHYEIFGSEEDDEDNDGDDGEDDVGSDDYISESPKKTPKTTPKTRGRPAKRSNSDESDIVRKTRRAQRRIIDDAMSEDSGVSDDNAALMAGKDVEGRDEADEEGNEIADAVLVASVDIRGEDSNDIDTTRSRSAEDIAAARKFSKKLRAVATKDLEEEMRRESQLEALEAALSHDGTSPAVRAASFMDSSEIDDMLSAADAFGPDMAAPKATETSAAHGCLLPPNDDDGELDDVHPANGDSGEQRETENQIDDNPNGSNGDNVESTNHDNIVSVALENDDDAVDESYKDDNANDDIDDAEDKRGNAKDESGRFDAQKRQSETETPLDSSIDLFESPHPRAALAKLTPETGGRNETSASKDSYDLIDAASGPVPPTVEQTSEPTSGAPDFLSREQSPSASSTPASTQFLCGFRSQVSPTRGSVRKGIDLKFDGDNDKNDDKIDESMLSVSLDTSNTGIRGKGRRDAPGSGKRPRGRPRKVPDQGSQRRTRSKSSSTEGVRTRSQEKEGKKPRASPPASKRGRRGSKK